MQINNLENKSTYSKARRYFCVALLGIFTFFAFYFITSYPSLTQADTATDTASDLQTKIQQQQALIDELNTKIEQYTDLSDKSSAQAKSLQDVIDGLKANQTSLNLDIQKTKATLDKTALEIQSLGGKITDSQTKIEDYKKAITQGIENVRETDDTGFVAEMLSGQSISDFLDTIDRQFQLTDDLKESTDDMVTTKQSLQDDQSSQLTKQQQLSDYQQQLLDKNKVIEYNKEQQAEALKEEQNKNKSYQQIIADNEAQETSLEQEVYSYESQLKYNANPSSLPPEGSAPFSWPVDKVYITQLFGQTVDSKRLYTSGSHNGVDFRASIGTPVKNTLTGVVVGTGNTDLTCPHASFGQWILIKHDDGLSSTFAHLSVISVKAGQQVKTGDIIGYSGATGYVTGPHLHISVYDSNAVQIQDRPSVVCIGHTYTMPIAPIDAYLDPMLYFPAYNTK